MPQPKRPRYRMKRVGRRPAPNYLKGQRPPVEAKPGQQNGLTSDIIEAELVRRTVAGRQGMNVWPRHPFGKRFRRARFRADVLVPRRVRLRIIPPLQRKLVLVRNPQPPVIALSL